jgi:hypothetical protein
MKCSVLVFQVHAGVFEDSTVTELTELCHVQMAAPCSVPSEFSIIYNGDLHEFDPVRRKWTQLSKEIPAPTPAGRCGLGFTAAAGRLLVFGGCTNACKLLASTLMHS